MGPGDALRQQGRTVAGDRRVTVRNALVVAQVAVSLVLIVAAGLFMQTFASLVRTPLGFEPSSLVIMNVDIKRSAASPATRQVLFERMREIAAAIPGVTGVSMSVITPVSGSGWNTSIQVGGGEARTAAPTEQTASRASERQRTMSWVNAVSAEWFKTYGMRLIAGRSFLPTDRAGSPAVAIVNEAFVQRFIPGGNPVGRVIGAGQIAGPGIDNFEIIGVVNNAIYRSTRSGHAPTMYVPLDQTGGSPSNLAFTLRAAVPEAQLHRQIDEALRSADPAAAFTFRRMDDLVSASTAQERVLALLSGWFGGIAVLLAALGLYGVTCYSVTRRRAEIGIRIALGADRSAVTRLVMRGVAALIGVGTVAGLLLSIWASRFVATLLFGLEPRDTWTFATAGAVLIGVGILAGWFPARRAARSDPMHVLRGA